MCIRDRLKTLYRDDSNEISNAGRPLPRKQQNSLQRVLHSSLQEGEVGEEEQKATILEEIKA